MLPFLNLPVPIAMKRKAASSSREREYEPCPPALAYEDNEVLNVDRNQQRVQGADALFRRNELKGLIDPLPETKNEVFQRAAMQEVDVSFSKVVEELYAVDERNETERSKRIQELKSKQHDDEAFLRGRRSDVVPQYRLKEISEPQRVIHIVEGGVFWDEDEKVFDKDYVTPEETDLLTVQMGNIAFTHSMLWCNPSPFWAWKNTSGGKRALRCKINIPAGTQVIIDRSPVFGGTDCDPNGEPKRRSKLPDVLLAPAEFKVDSVQYYRTTKAKKEDAMLKQELYTYVESGHKGRVVDDETYIKRTLEEVDEFIDVEMTIVNILRLPAPL